MYKPSSYGELWGTSGGILCRDPGLVPLYLPKLYSHSRALASQDMSAEGVTPWNLAYISLGLSMLLFLEICNRARLSVVSEMLCMLFL